ncbi:unnamed protein product [Lactuca virosa]|uniref:Uncharacterized protein n=1 Tax=Lactuca virosa TaxID=75947 RepID=A0AAU9MWC3_9ASTR|nr:unnamed protein product [Lactuca virosa]
MALGLQKYQSNSKNFQSALLHHRSSPRKSSLIDSAHGNSVCRRWIHRTQLSLSMVICFAAISTDEKQISVKGHPPSDLSTFVEVIGVADSAQSIRAEIVTNFGDTFDTNNFNQLCQLANGEFRHLFI